MGVGDGATTISVAGAEKVCRLVFLDEDKGLWRCQHCTWTYGLLANGLDHFQSHESSDRIAMAFKTLRQTQDADYIKPMASVDTYSFRGTSHKGKSSAVSAPRPAVILPECDVQIHVENQVLAGTTRESEYEVLKSIVYGGLIESIISLCIVSSAAGANALTSNIVSLGLANLIGGFPVMLHNLSEIKEASSYWILLGRRENFRLHATVSVISFVFFGLLPPLIYSFSFRASTGRELRLIVVAAVSLACIALLAIGKARVTARNPYLKFIGYYLGLGLASASLGYLAGVKIDELLIAGVKIDELLEQLHLFEFDVISPLFVEVSGLGFRV